MPQLTREQILDCDDLVREKVEVPEWGEGMYVYVQSMTAGQRNKFEAKILKFKEGGFIIEDYQEARALLASMTIVNELGRPMFTPDDIPGLLDKSVKALARIEAAARRLSAMDDAAIADLEKNSEAGPAGDTNSV